jgi:hypothetical protein
MKSLVVVLGLFAAVSLTAETTLSKTDYPQKPGQPSTPAPADAKAPVGKPADTKTVKPAAKADPAKPADKKEAEPKIPGQTIDRDDGGYLGLELKDGNFKLSFYDKKKKAIPADRAMAIARWLVKYNKSGDERALLSLSSDGKSLVGSKNVRAPYSFKLYLTLFKEATEGAPAVENYIIDFSG